MRPLYTGRLLSGTDYHRCCHSNLIRALAGAAGLSAEAAEPLVHDVLNVFMSFILDNAIRRFFQDPVKITGPYIRPGDTVIDFGCGPGYFTTAMAKLTGPEGKVWAVELQPEMLEKVNKKCRAMGLSAIVTCHPCSEHAFDLDSAVQADFMLAYYMVHEIPDNQAFFEQAYPLLKPGGRILVVEPPFHVSKTQFKTISAAALEAGFTPLDTPKGKGGRTLLLTR